MPGIPHCTILSRGRIQVTLWHLRMGMFADIETVAVRLCYMADSSRPDVLGTANVLAPAHSSRSAATVNKAAFARSLLSRLYCCRCSTERTAHRSALHRGMWLDLSGRCANRLCWTTPPPCGTPLFRDP